MRAWAGVDAQVTACLEMTMRNLCGSDVDIHSDIESDMASPAAKCPCLANTWSDSEHDPSTPPPLEVDERMKQTSKLQLEFQL